jgi:hypothetical protein
LNKKQTYLLTTASAVIGLTVGVGTAGYRYFKNEENREKFLNNSTVQKLRENTNTLFEQVRNGHVKLTSSQKLSDVADEVSEVAKEVTKESTNTVSNEANESSSNAKNEQNVKNETTSAPAPASANANATTANGTTTKPQNSTNVKPSQQEPKNVSNKNTAKN